MRGTTAALALAASITFAGCASTDQVGSGGPAAEAPAWRVADRWVYRITDGFRAPLSWNAPAVGAMVRADKSAHFVQSARGGFGAVTTQRAQVELASYNRAAP